MGKNFKYLIALIIGHLTVFKHIFKKPVTLEYPEKKAELNDYFRGKHIFIPEKCTACGTCQRVCPSFGTIDIVKEKDESGKLHAKAYTLDYSKCIFCGNCVQYCPFDAIKMTKEYELADEKKSALKLDINALKNNDSDNIINKQG